MISNTESYINSSYLSKYPSVATHLICCAALSYGGMINSDCYFQSFDNTDRPCGYNHEIFRNAQTLSWISFNNISIAELNHDIEVIFDATACLDIVKKLSFMTVDEKVDKRIEEYFASIPVKTKVIFKNHRINKE